MRTFDKKPSLASWPYEIHKKEDIIEHYKDTISSIILDDFDSYKVIYFPMYDNMICYGNDMIYYIDQKNQIQMNRKDIIEVETFKELLEASMTIKTKDQQIKIRYVTATYFLFDPLLNYLCHLPDNYSLYKIEKMHPRPKALYIDSLCMYNYCLYAYRLGYDLLNYDYRYKNRREKWMPWKVHKEEWLSITNTQGVFQCYSYKYIIRCQYIFKR